MESTVFQPGFRLGKYEVMTHLFTGGMGSVYQAIDRDLNRIVALKVLAPGRTESGLSMERFRREARNAARLNHPNIVTLFDCGYDAQRKVLYLALEFIDGMDLARHIAKHGSLRPEETRRILMQSTKALAHAFAHGIVHRDIKPANIMLTRVGGKIRVKMTDLGLAIAKGEDEYRLTREGNTVGTIDYMAPEQARDSQSADTRSDIYSLGCTAYHMLAGKPPFAQGGLGERLFRHLEMPPPDVRQFNPAVSFGFWTIIEKMLAKKPEDRYTTPDVLLQALKCTPAEDAVAENAAAPLSSARRATQHVSTAPTRVSIPAEEATPGIDGARFVRPEQGQAAADLYERALQILAQKGGNEYARQLLENALKLNPFNVACRQALRVVRRNGATGFLDQWFHALNVFIIKATLRHARSHGDWRTALEQGEHVLACQPADAETHLELAETATEIGFPDLARWFLEQGRLAMPDNGELVRAQARLHEHLRQWKPAIALWQYLIELEPANDEARCKVTELSAQEMLAVYQHRRD